MMHEFLSMTQEEVIDYLLERGKTSIAIGEYSFSLKEIAEQWEEICIKVSDYVDYQRQIVKEILLLLSFLQTMSGKKICGLRGNEGLLFPFKDFFLHAFEKEDMLATRLETFLKKKAKGIFFIVAFDEKGIGVTDHEGKYLFLSLSDLVFELYVS